MDCKTSCIFIYRSRKHFTMSYSTSFYNCLFPQCLGLCWFICEYHFMAVKYVASVSYWLTLPWSCVLVPYSISFMVRLNLRARLYRPWVASGGQPQSYLPLAAAFLLPALTDSAFVLILITTSLVWFTFQSALQHLVLRQHHHRRRHRPVFQHQLQQVINDIFDAMFLDFLTSQFFHSLT